ncbi:MAG: phosphoribosylformimino-5-aminoimidazole carboxamide ribotide isomerase [Lachnospiraceae bacterium]|nr:phosphoribosylformimino-5-aminoimidazole carboxamide ribotide isomerase [Lachnospiraceae bacterium]
MRFRPCIDIHNGKVKQIVGGSLTDEKDAASENYVSGKDAAYYAGLFRKMKLTGGHVIVLNPVTSEYHEASKRQAMGALSAYPGGMMAGGGIGPENAKEYIDAGASHVIVTSYVFREGRIDYDRLEQMRDAVGREHLCLDLSCRVRDGSHYIVTDRWQKYTDERLDETLLEKLAAYASEYLVHAVDVEGKQQGIDEEILPVLAASPIPVTYAGGVGSIEDIETLKKLGGSRIDVTVGSALAIYGGKLEMEEILACIS